MTLKIHLKSEQHQHFLCIELLKKFSKKEIDGFIRFVSSPYFNSDHYIIKLLKVIEKQVLSQAHFSPELHKTVYEKVFAEKVMVTGLNSTQKKRFNHKLNILLRLAEQFLTIEGLDEYATYRDEILYQKILDKKQFKLFNRHINKEKKLLEQSSERGIEYYEHLYHIENNVLNYLHRNGELHRNDNLPDLIHHLDIRYLLNKLSLQITLLTLATTTKKTYDTTSIEATLSLLDLPQYAEHPLIQVYQATIDLLSTQSEKAYRELLILLNQNATNISKKDLNGFYIGAANFCSQQIREGKFDYHDWFEILQIMEEKDLLIEGDFIPVIKLKNAVTAGCRVGKFDWAMAIIEKYKPYVRQPVQESVYHYNMGVVAFYQKDYTKTLYHFVRADTVNLSYDINCRTMIMKAHYEMDKDYDERTLQIYRSTEKYFKTHASLTSKTKKAYKNFIRILINLYRIRHQATRMTLISLQEKLEKQEVNSDKRWLLEKIGELRA